MLLHYVLLLEHDPPGLRFIEGTLARTSRRDILLFHEPVLSRGLLLLQTCHVQLILLDTALPGGTLDEILCALWLQTPGTPIVALQGPAGQSLESRALRIIKPPPLGICAIVATGDEKGLLGVMDEILGPGIHQTG